MSEKQLPKLYVNLLYRSVDLSLEPKQNFAILMSLSRAFRGSRLKLCYCKHMIVKSAVVQHGEHKSYRTRVIRGCEEMSWWSGSGAWYDVLSKHHHQVVMMMKGMSMVACLEFDGSPTQAQKKKVQGTYALTITTGGEQYTFGLFPKPEGVHFITKHYPSPMLLRRERGNPKQNHFTHVLRGIIGSK